MGKESSAKNDPMAGWAMMMQAQAAQAQTALGHEWLAFSKEQFGVANKRQEGIDKLVKGVAEGQITAQNNANKWATEDRQRWKTIFQPLQDKFIKKANDWDSADRQAQAASEARADVMSNAALQQDQVRRTMEARGVNPDSGQYAGTQRAVSMETGLAAAGAQNNARNQLRKEAMALQGDALNIGNGLPSQANQSLGIGVGAGSAASGNTIAAGENWRNNIGIMNAGYGGAMTGYNNAASQFGNIYSNRVDMLNASDKMRADSMNGIAGGIGSIFGALISDEDAKENKKPAKGILQAVKNMRVEEWDYKDGEGDGGRHVGTYAQDFQRETGMGDGKTINVIDALGVTMGAVKELANKVDKLERPTRANKPRPRSIMKEAA